MGRVQERLEREKEGREGGGGRKLGRVVSGEGRRAGQMPLKIEHESALVFGFDKTLPTYTKAKS